MICRSVYKKDELACVAGFADATILTARLSGDAADKVCVRTFGAGGEGAEDGTTPWLHKKLEQGQSLAVRVSW